MLVFGVFFYACSKDNPANNTPDDKVLDTYYPGPSIQIKQLAIYTKDGIISDPEFIDGYIDRNVNDDLKSKFYVGASSVPTNGYNTTLKILDNSRVNISGVNMEITGYKDSLMLVSEYTSSPVPVYGISTCSDLFAKVPAFTPLSGCQDSTCASYRKTYPIITNGDSEYYIPVITYAALTNQCSFSSAQWPVINVLDTDLQSYLVAGDSVLVQYAKIPLVKQTK
jgi:hypothetical protein